MGEEEKKRFKEPQEGNEIVGGEAVEDQWDARRIGRIGLMGPMKIGPSSQCALLTSICPICPMCPIDPSVLLALRSY